MTELKRTVWRSALTSLLLLGVMSPATATDLSRYRMFQLGTDLPLVAKQAGLTPSEAKVIHRRPALIQELEWRPLGSPSQSEFAKQLVFTFSDGELFRIAIDYDRRGTEGLTADDLVHAISATYGTSAKPIAPAKTVQGRYGDEEEVLAQWQDLQYRFELVRSSYGPSFKLVGVLTRLEAPAKAAVLEAKRLDDQEAPERDAARLASEQEAARAKVERARVVNKEKFRP